MQIATCIGCGCTDHRACIGDEGPCHWLEVDYASGCGVCSCCPDQLPRWHAGERTMLMLVAKIAREGETQPFYLERNDMASFPHLLDVKPGDRFSVEWVEMSSEQFEALPQFEHVRQARQWVAACHAAEEAEEKGLLDQASGHRAEANRIAALVVAAGYDIESLADLVA